MRKITVLSMITLDGVMQAPGAPTEDPSGGFKYGGWVAPYDDEVYGKAVMEELKPAQYLLGRKTFEIWASYWPEHGEYWPAINESMKYVFSTRLTNGDPLVSGWKNSTVVSSVSDIKNLKDSTGSDIQVWGSSELVHLLLAHDLVDELRLKIHPLMLGQGKKLFDRTAMPVAFTLVENQVTPSGVIMATYQRADEVKTGTVGPE